MNYLEGIIVDKALNNIIVTRLNKHLELRFIKGEKSLNQLELKNFIDDIASNTLANLEVSN